MLGGSNDAIYRWFQKNSCCYSEEIDNVMTATRYSQLKLSMKLCHNSSAPKREDEGYDPAYKYDLIYKTNVHDCNGFTLYTYQNQVIDESAW